MLPPKTWRRAPPEFKKMWLQLDKDLKVEMLNNGKKNSELITTSPTPNAAFLADILSTSTTLQLHTIWMTQDTRPRTRIKTLLMNKTLSQC